MKKKFLIVMLCLVFCVVGSVMMFACGEETVAITWNIDKNATVSVEGSDTVPAEGVVDSTVKFTVNCASGYEVDAVKVNGKEVYAKNGAYEFKLTKETTVDITVTPIVKSVAVTTNPTDMQYFHGESLDKTGMVVEVTYETGEKTTVTNYSVSPSTFSAGDTSFKVSYGGKSSAEVQLEGTVEYLVTIDPDGGVIAQELLDKYKTFNNYSVDETTGEIKFSFLNLTEAIALPDEETITKDKFEFVNWTNSMTSIPTTTADNVSISATWQPIFVEFTKLSLEMVEVDGKQVPHLVMNGKFVNADEAYLYLYEGNDKVELKGTEIKRGETDEFELSFDLTKLSNLEGNNNPQAYKGKWMDIRINAMMGEEEESQQIYIPTEGMEIDLSQKIYDENYTYRFQTWTENGTTTLKVLYEDSAAVQNYTASIADESFNAGDGAKVQPVLTISGSLTPKYTTQGKGGQVGVSFYAGAETEVFKGAVNASGEFTIKIPLSVIKKDTDAFAHVYLYNAKEELIYGGSGTNLLVADCTTTMDEANDIGFVSAKKFACESTGLLYYIGAKWDGFMVYVKDNFIQEKITLVTEGDKVYMVLEGSTNFTSADFEEGGKFANYGMDVEEYQGSNKTKLEDTITIADGKFTLKVDVTNVAAYEKFYLCHWIDAEGNSKDFSDMVGNSIPENSTVTVGGKTYTLSYENVENWGKRLILTVRDAAAV